MLARRIIVVSPDVTVQQALAAETAGDIEVQPTLESIPQEFGEVPVIAVLPRAQNLAAVVDVMRRADRVAVAVLADDLDPARLAALAARVRGDDLVGLDQVMAPATKVDSVIVGDAAAKSRCMARISELVDHLGLPRSYGERIEQCVDEMVMNALYDAPVDDSGTHIFAGVPARTRITMRTEHDVVVHYASDGKQLAVSVRDAFGSLERATVLGYLHKSLHAEHAVDRKAGGAGLGLYLMATAATAVFFHVIPGIATEATCVFDLHGGNQSLQQLGFVVHDAAGHGTRRAGHRIVVARSRRRRVFAAAMAALAVVLGVVVAFRVLRPSNTARITFTTTNGAAIDLEARRVGIASDGTLSIGDLASARAYRVVARLDGYEPKRAVVRPHRGANEVSLELRAVATVEVESEPTDATISIDGLAMGSTPLELTALAPGATVSIVFERPGYQPVTASVQVPARGHRQRVVQALEISNEVVRVHFVSNPPGAAIVRDGEQLEANRTYTPADVFVAANQVQRFSLIMPKHQPFVIAPFTPARGTPVVEQGGDLVPLAP